MQKIIITGHTKGLGADLYNYYDSKYKNSYIIQGFNSKNTYVDIVNQSKKNCYLFINNACPSENFQLNLINDLKYSVKNMVVFGSLAGDGAGDTIYPDYSADKKKLKKFFLNQHRKMSGDTANMLLLKLNSLAYKNTELIIKTIDFWLANPEVLSIDYCL